MKGRAGRTVEVTRVGAAWKDRNRRGGWGPRVLVKAEGQMRTMGCELGDREQVVGSWDAAPLGIEEILELEPENELY